METWSIGIDSWVIQDGNYPDFVAGQAAEFALELYWPDAPALIDGGSKSVRALANGWHEITGIVVATADDTWVVDFGLLAYDDCVPPAGIDVGQWVTGKVLIQVDYYWYFEVLSRRDGFPPQIYSWAVDSIRRHTAPFVLNSDGKSYIREPGNETYVEISATDAWHDQDGHASYVLECRLTDRAPARQLGPPHEQAPVDLDVRFNPPGR